jgi:RimJ/RimL family protein N-acetyltransferase
MSAQMEVTVTEDFAAFDTAVADFLRADPVGNTVLLTIVETLRVGGRYPAPPWFGWVTGAGRVLGVASRTPPYLVALGPMPTEAAEALGAGLSHLDLPGAMGREEVTAAFARGCGRSMSVRMRELQYVLEELVDPPPVRGEPRAYDPDDPRQRSLYLDWIVAFEREAGLRGHPDALAALDSRLATGGQLWWWDFDGRPVCMAGRGPAVGGVPRVGPVWTPPEQRRKGYAAALTAHMCRDALAAGARACTLFADAANPTSNGVYRRIGFTEVGTIIEADFGGRTHRG